MLEIGRLSGFCRRSLIVAATAVLSACGGGGGGGGSSTPSASFRVSPTALTFNSFENAATPIPQAVSITVNGTLSGTLFFKIVVTGDSGATILSATVTGQNTGQAFVSVPAPNVVGPGTHTGTLSVVACVNDSNCSGPLLGGSPQTIAVNYVVASALQGEAVAPHAVSSNIAGEVVIRGLSLPAITSVSFGGNSATSFTQVSATEIRAAYSALPAGTYTVQLQNASGPVAFSAGLVVVDPAGYAATTLSYPPSPGTVRSMVYDPVRRAIIVATDTQLLRYAAVGTTFAQPPAQSAIADLRDISLSTDGASLLALTRTSLLQRDPASLALTISTNAPDSGGFPIPLTRLAVANTGVALVASEDFDVFLYPVRNPSFTRALLTGSTSGTIFGALPAAGGNGSLVAFIQGQLSPPPEALKYLASTGQLSAPGIKLNRVSINAADVNLAPSVDRSGTRIAFNSSVGDFSGVGVFNDGFTLLGRLPATTLAVAFAPIPSGPAARAYTLDSPACTLRAFDLSTLNSGNFVEILTGPYPISISCPGNHPNIAMTPDGATAILAGDQQVVIVSTP